MLFQSYCFLILLSVCCVPCLSSSGDRLLRFLNNLPTTTTGLIDPLSSVGFYYGINPDSITDTLVGEPSNKKQHINDDVSTAQSEREAEFATIGTDVEQWAEDVLADQNGWTEVLCSKLLREKFNAHGQTQQFIKWMKDSRVKHASLKNTKKHPCMKLTSSIDAPLELVCLYLSQEDRCREYNSLLIDQRVLETFTSHSKICWGQSRKLRK